MFLMISGMFRILSGISLTVTGMFSIVRGTQ